MPCSAFRRNSPLLRISTQRAVASDVGAAGCCFGCWGREALPRPVKQRAPASDVGAVGCCFGCWGSGALRRVVKHGIGRREHLPPEVVARGPPSPSGVGRRRLRSAGWKRRGSDDGGSAPAPGGAVAPRPPRRGISPQVSRSSTLVGGGVSEWPKERASKARVGASPPRVRIPAPPPGSTVGQRRACAMTHAGLSGNHTLARTSH